jgi:hypothetical protein
MTLSVACAARHLSLVRCIVRPPLISNRFGDCLKDDLARGRTDSEGGNLEMSFS